MAARPEGPLRRALRWAGRHRLASGLAARLVVGLAAVAVLPVVHARHAGPLARQAPMPVS